jgi:predicted metal-dependent hydrolase
LPVDLIRYIIIHELTHLRYPNHGNEFHAFIRMFFRMNKTSAVLSKNTVSIMNETTSVKMWFFGR